MVFHQKKQKKEGRETKMNTKRIKKTTNKTLKSIIKTTKKTPKRAPIITSRANIGGVIFTSTGIAEVKTHHSNRERRKSPREPNKHNPPDAIPY
ncbi:hypothetical protein [Serratia rhizosphaerae]|uniref:Uncharacterized protein n=1 Tax=Serratia rhizosphaerae TaxID=2597702 RepID=A0ABX6GP33_9GAMM|nr:hypothetical protein [Serratia rhizosphaerae]QHA87998.1 hypothetical protein FO014_14070 [Serratia rhizosphaerae]